MLCRWASPQLMHHAEWRADVAIGIMCRTYPFGVHKGHSSTVMPPIEPPITTATDDTLRWSRTSLCNLMGEKYHLRHCCLQRHQLVAHRTSSLIVVAGNMGPYGFPVLRSVVIGDAVPYGEPSTLMHTMKKRPVSNAFPRPISGPHLEILLASRIKSIRGELRFTSLQRRQNQ